MAITTLTEGSFDEFIAETRSSSSTSGPNGAGPCKMIAPILEEIADERADSLSIGKVDIDAGSNVQVGHRYGVRSIPTLMVFKDGDAGRDHRRRHAQARPPGPHRRCALSSRSRI